MARIDLSHNERTEWEQMWSLMSPATAKAANEFSSLIQSETILPVQVHEAARIRIAHLNGCEICCDARVTDMESHGLDEAFYADVDDPKKRDHYELKPRLAIAFAERFVAGKHAFDDGFWGDLRVAFSDAEIVDLTASCAKWLGLGRMNAVLDLAVACPVSIPAPRHAVCG